MYTLNLLYYGPGLTSNRKVVEGVIFYLSLVGENRFLYPWLWAALRLQPTLPETDVKNKKKWFFILLLNNKFV